MKINLALKNSIILFILFLSVQNSIIAQNNIELADSIIKKYSSLDKKGNIDILANKCWEFRESNSKQAIKMVLYAISLAEDFNYSEELPKLFNFTGSIYLNYLYDINNAIPYLQKARDLSIKNKDSIQLGYAFNNLGDLYYITNNIPLSIQFGLKSNEVFNKLNFKAGIAYSLKNLGVAFNANRDYDTALKYFNNLFKLETELSNKAGIAFSLLGIGNTCFNQNNYNKALEYYNKALKLTPGFKDDIFKAKCLNGISNICIKNREYDKSLELTEKAIVLNTLSDYKPGIIKTKLNIALIHSLTNHRIQGEKTLNEALSLSYDIGFHSFILESYQTKVKFYTNLNDDDLTIESYKKYLSVYDSLFSIKSFETITEIQKSLQSQLTIDKISQDLASRKKQRAYMYIIIGLLLALALIIYWRNRSSSTLNKKLVETNNTKDKLFSIVSHDLKSPFNTLLGFSEMLKEALANKEYVKAEEYSEILEQTTNSTYLLINNLLDWSRTQQEKLILNQTNFNIAELITEITTLKSLQAKVKNIKFDNSRLENNSVFADRNCIYIVFSNLISNAIKFTPNNGVISFKTIVKNSEIEIDVTDNGIGISEKVLKNLFDIRNSKSTLGTNNEHGTGLGLIICKEFIEKSEGSLNVESILGKGSTFKVRLPLL